MQQKHMKHKKSRKKGAEVTETWEGLQWDEEMED